VLKEPVIVSQESLNKFREIVAAFPGYDMAWPQNNRPVRPIDGRTVLGRQALRRRLEARRPARGAPPHAGRSRLVAGR
jgi:hypothetical protein